MYDFPEVDLNNQLVGFSLKKTLKKAGSIAKKASSVTPTGVAIRLATDKKFRAKAGKLAKKISGDYDPNFELGFSLKKVVKKAGSAVKKVAKSAAVNPVKQVKAVTKAAKKVAKVAAPVASKLASAAKVAGPAIASIYPPAGAALGVASKLVSAAQKGASDAKAKISEIQTMAKAGVAQAQKASDMLEVAKSVNNNVVLTELLKKAGMGDLSAKATISQIEQLAAAGNPEQQQMLADMKAAQKGMQLQLATPVEAARATIDKNGNEVIKAQLSPGETATYQIIAGQNQLVTAVLSPGESITVKTTLTASGALTIATSPRKVG